MEIAILASAMAGGLFSFALIVVYFFDRRRIVRAKVNGPFLRLANGNLRNEALRFWMLAGFAYIAALYMTLPPFTRSANREAGALVAYIILSWIVVLVGGSLLDFWDRARNWTEIADQNILLDSAVAGIGAQEQAEGGR
jgi:hypothetical protein